MSLFKDTITVYNHRIDAKTGKDLWRRHVVNGVQWTHGKRHISIVNGIATENIVESITIDFDRKYADRNTYIEPLLYENIPEDEAGNFWTLDQQGGMDYIVLGETDYEPSRMSELLNKFQYAGVIVSVSDHRNRPRLRHIKVVVK